MSKAKNWLVILLVVIVVVLAIIVALVIKQKTATNNKIVTPNVTNNQSMTSVETPVNTVTGTGTTGGDQFRVEAPTNIKVPEANDKTLTEEQKKDVSIPTVVTPAAPGVQSSYRSFDLRGEGGLFAPSKIIVRMGDTIHINFSAVDKDYDFILPSYGVKTTAKKGQVKVIEFYAVQDGSYTYYCESCGGINSTAKGEIVIVK